MKLVLSFMIAIVLLYFVFRSRQPKLQRQQQPSSGKDSLVKRVLDKRLEKREISLAQARNLYPSMLRSLQPDCSQYDPHAYQKFKEELKN